MTIVHRVFAFAAVVAGAAWLTKTALIAANGGTNTDEGIVAVCWALGMLGCLVAAATGGVLLAHRAPAWARVVAALVAVPVAFVVLGLVDTMVKAAYAGDGWFRDELSLLVVGVVLGAVGAAALRAEGTPTAVR